MLENLEQIQEMFRLLEMQMEVPWLVSRFQNLVLTSLCVTEYYLLSNYVVESLIAAVLRLLQINLVDLKLCILISLEFHVQGTFIAFSVATINIIVI